MARLSSHADDPFLIIAMFQQRHNDLLEEKGEIFMRHTRELERSAEFARDCGSDLIASVAKIKSDSSEITTDMMRTTDAMSHLQQTIDRLIHFADEGTYRLHSAGRETIDGQRRWRLDLKLLRWLTTCIVVGVLAYIGVIIARRPPLSVETAAAMLVSSPSVPGLIELQRDGDLAALLDCRGTGWTRTAPNFCRPVGGRNTIEGWHTGPASPTFD